MVQAPLYIVNLEAVVVRDGRYLMVVRSEQEEHAPGTLSMPGGKVEGAADSAAVAEETLCREVLEETGVAIDPALVYIESKLFSAADGQPVVDLVFLCRYRGGTAAAIDPAEVGAVAWMSAAEVLDHPKAPPWTRRSIGLAEQKRLALGW